MYTSDFLSEFQKVGVAHPPNEHGRFGDFGGRYIPETLMSAVLDLHDQFSEAWADADFLQCWLHLLQDYVGRPSPLYYAQRLSEATGANVYLKREDLNHTGAHKINNTLGQALLARRFGKNRIIAETGAGQHGVASATAAALLGMECTVYMGAVDVERQALNVRKMQMLGAKVEAVTSGTSTLKDATNEALRRWVADVDDTHYIIGSAVGPHPYPWMVRAFQSIIGFETLQQLEQKNVHADVCIACVGGGSNASGFLHPFVDTDAELIAVEAGGLGQADGEHGASLNWGAKGVLHGSMSLLLQTHSGQIQPAHSISAGLDYPGVGPELAHWYTGGRLRIATCSDTDSVKALKELNRLEGILPALESSHALSALYDERLDLKGKNVVVALSGRGDKDIDQLIQGGLV